MNLLLLYLLLTKATLTSFSGLTSLPIVRHDLVEHYQVAHGPAVERRRRRRPRRAGPNGLYLVSIGYFVAGVPGGCAGLLAVVTPAFLIIPMLQYLGRKADKPAVKSAIRAVTLAAAGLVVTTTVPLARDALTGALPIAIAAGSFLFLVLTKRATVWVIAAAALAGFAGAWLR